MKSITLSCLKIWSNPTKSVRHEVAKQTRSLDRKRYVPIEPTVAKNLQPLAGQGPVISCCDNHFFIHLRELKAAVKIKLPENCLRNSYATYALTFRSLGDVARANRDAESAPRLFVLTLVPLLPSVGRRVPFSARQSPASRRLARSALTRMGNTIWTLILV